MVEPHRNHHASGSDVPGDGITESRTYSNDNLLTTINYSNASLGNLTYTWDTNKNKTSESIGGVMSGYGFTNAGTTYDDEDRLTGYQRTNGALSQSWNLTSVGDWNSVTTNGTAQSRTHGPTHELLTAGGQTVNTDVKGNITLLPSALSSLASTALGMSWDFDNKLKSVDIGNNSSTDVEYKYDALGRRVARVGSSGSFVYVQSDQQTIADYGVGDAPSSPLYRYVYASYIDEPVVRKGAGTGGTIHYYHRNQQYSINAITTSTGTVAERYAYSAYGEPTICDSSGSPLSSSAINNRYTYTGREWDGTVGLYHFRARWMSPKTGRFLVRDPIGYSDGMGLYSYLRGQSLVTADPMGLSSIAVKVNAFISNQHDPDGDGWIPLFPTSMSWWFVGTDKRMGGEAGTSRLSKAMSISSCQVGREPPTDDKASGSGTKFGVGQATCGGLCWYNVVQTDFRTGPVFENDGIGVKPECNSYWSGQFWGNMPFLYRVSPNIDVDGRVDFNAGVDTVTVNVSLSVSAFPDFEVLVTADGMPCVGSPHVEYSDLSHPAWGLSYISWSSKQKIKASFQCPGKTHCDCGGTCNK